MAAEQKDMRVPAELLPRCPVCGRPMSMNLRCDQIFVQDSGWYAAAERYERFLQQHERLRVVYLELGVGGNTPAIIKYPFWRLTELGEPALGLHNIDMLLLQVFGRRSQPAGR